MSLNPPIATRRRTVFTTKYNTVSKVQPQQKHVPTQSEPDPLLLELLLLLPDLLLAAGLPVFDLEPDLDLLLLDADPLLDLLLLFEIDLDLDFLPAASGLREGDLLTDLDLLRLTDLETLLDLLLLTLFDLLRLTDRDLLRLTLRDLLLLTDLDLLRLFDLDLLRDFDLEADRDRDFDLDSDLDLSPVLVARPSSSSSSSSSSDISSSSCRGSRFFSLYLCILCSCLLRGLCLTTSLLLLAC